MALSYKNDEKEDERLDPYSDSARDLYSQERNGFADDNIKEENAAARDKEMGAIKEQEENAPWTTKVGQNDEGKGGKKQKVKGNFLKKKGPLGIIIGLVVGGGGGLGLLLSPAGALIHIKEIVVGKFDSMSSVVTARSDLGLKNRMFGTNATCVIKVKCRFNGLTERQMQRLNAQGVELVDENGKPVTKNKLGRYTGGRTLILPNGEKVTASSYKRALRSSSELRDISRKVFAPRYLSWNDKISKEIRAKKKLVTNPDWGKEGDEKEARKSVYKATSGESYTAEVRDNTEYQTKDGKPVLDDNGKPIPVEGAHTPDFGEDTDDINREAEKLKTQAEAGDLVKQIPSDPAGAAIMPDYKATGSPLKNALIGLFNPTDFLVSLCTTYQITNALVLTAKTIALANAMRYASQFVSTADKMKAGEGTSDDVEKAMTILQREDEYGDSFGDSVGYQYPEYGTIPDKSIASSAAGNGVVFILASAIGWVNGKLGGGKTVRTMCNVLTNPFVQGVLSLTTFIPGAGQAAKLVTKAFTVAGKEAAERIVRSEVEKIIAKIAAKVSKDELKKTAKEATKIFLKIALGAGGMFLAGYLLTKYAIPYLARVLSGTELTGSENGVTAMDTIANGFDATNSATAAERGLTPLTKDEYLAFEKFNDESTATYVADMRAKSDPFDLNDPYSAGNSLASAFYMFGSKLNVFQHPSDILTAPGAILSSLNPNKLLTSNAFADTKQDLAYCTDEFLQNSGLATSPFCNVKYGFNDTTMLENEDPNHVIDWMLDHQQIDNDGNPVDESEFAAFKSKCVDDASSKVTGDIGEADQILDPECYGPKNKTEQWKYFRLYIIDTGVDAAMEESMESTDSPSNTETTDPSQPVSYVPVEQDNPSTPPSPKNQVVARTDNKLNDVLSRLDMFGITPTRSITDIKKWELTYDS